MHCVFFSNVLLCGCRQTTSHIKHFLDNLAIISDRIEHVEALGLSGRLSVWSDLLVVGF